ncbi:uncharacterized protein LOC110685110 [Chenopodium quinoa]|uniref:uncharacterized protein LOC110685110 n=1 Tax=Chenopodium quinoa TaxID=63459 RepID=UPI000B76DD4C|nr:uncharacterized protein LOC110685110 [Chenopodium quinoa]
MIVLSWNIRGLNDPGKVAVLKRLLSKQNYNVVCILETKVKEHISKSIQKKFGASWAWHCNYASSYRGRIWVGWKTDYLNLDILASTEQFVHCLLCSKDLQVQILVTFVYGLHSIQKRKQLWSGLKGLPTAIIPWLCIGDFNSILSAGDRLNGATVSDYETRYFMQCIDDLALVEIKSKGAPYFWCNKAHTGPRTFTRIDRGLVNQEWLNLYGHVEAIFLPPSLTDHSPIALDILHFQPGKGRPFRFLKCLADHDSFFSTVANAWQAHNTSSAMYRVWYKLKQVKTALKNLSTQKFGDVNAKVETAHNNLISIQHQMSDDMSNTELHVQELEAIENVKKWLGIQESIYKQKSRVDWLQLGDENNKFFFSVMKNRQSRNRIDALYTEQDVLLRIPGEIVEELTGFYKQLLGS